MTKHAPPSQKPTRFLTFVKIGAVLSGMLMLGAGAQLLSIHASLADGQQGSADLSCIVKGQWLDPAKGTLLSPKDVVSGLAKKPVVLLGETHDDADHHRWQLQMLAALHGANPNMVIAFEMFPRRVQPVLDRWTRGELTTHDFLKQAEWTKVWGIATQDYMPLFHFARMNHIPMVAMNVDRTVVGKISKEGLEALSPEEREGVSDPAQPPEAYLTYLTDIYGRHSMKGNKLVHGDKKDPSVKDDSPEEATEEKTDTRNDPAFIRFSTAQAFWDRAMAEAIHKVRTAGGNPLVVGIVGRGHLQYRHGIPHQLADLGIKDAAVALPGDASLDCNRLKDSDGQHVANLIFGMGDHRSMAAGYHGQPSEPRMMLGVVIKPNEVGGVLVERVLENSVAETTGIKVGDVIVKAAGQPMADPAELIATIGKQAPGTWLPLLLKREDDYIDAVAKFPPLHS